MVIQAEGKLTRLATHSIKTIKKAALTADPEIVSEYDLEKPQSQTADNPVAPREEPLNHHDTPGRQIKQSNQLSLPHQDDCNTRMDIK